MKETKSQGTQQFILGKTQQKVPQYRLPVWNDQRPRSHQVRDQNPRIISKTPKTLVLLLLCLSLFLSLAQYKCE